MTRKLQRHGNSYALVFDKAMMGALNFTPDSPMQVVVSGASVIVTPGHAGVPSADLATAIGTIWPRYKKTLENLAK